MDGLESEYKCDGVVTDTVYAFEALSREVDGFICARVSMLSRVTIVVQRQPYSLALRSLLGYACAGSDTTWTSVVLVPRKGSGTINSFGSSFRELRGEFLLNRVSW